MGAAAGRAGLCVGVPAGADILMGGLLWVIGACALIILAGIFLLCWTLEKLHRIARKNVDRG